MTPKPKPPKKGPPKTIYVSIDWWDEPCCARSTKAAVREWCDSSRRSVFTYRLVPPPRARKKAKVRR